MQPDAGGREAGKGHIAAVVRERKRHQKRNAGEEVMD
jgi:hypothetical protein